MGIQNSNIAEGATVSSSGGTAKTFALTSTKINNGIKLVDNSVADIRVRPYLIATAVEPKLANGKWKKGTVGLQYGRPKILADGSQEFPNIQTFLNTHPESTDAEVAQLLLGMAQALISTAFASLWKQYNLS